MQQWYNPVTTVCTLEQCISISVYTVLLYKHRELSNYVRLRSTHSSFVQCGALNTNYPAGFNRRHGNKVTHSQRWGRQIISQLCTATDWTYYVRPIIVYTVRNITLSNTQHINVHMHLSIQVYVTLYRNTRKHKFK